VLVAGLEITDIKGRGNTINSSSTAGSSFLFADISGWGDIEKVAVDVRKKELRDTGEVRWLGNGGWCASSCPWLHQVRGS